MASQQVTKSRGWESGADATYCAALEKAPWRLALGLKYEQMRAVRHAGRRISVVGMTGAARGFVIDLWAFPRATVQ
jgi:hypothetical protein